MMKRRQRGVTTVELAFIGATALLVLFAVIEIGRAMFVLNALGEVTRRGARFAAVCPLNDPAIVDVALLNAPGSGANGSMVGALSGDNIVVEYLDDGGAVLGDPAGDFIQIRFVRVRVADFQHRMLIPFADYVFTTPELATTVRRESLGVPRSGTVEPC